MSYKEFSGGHRRFDLSSRLYVYTWLAFLIYVLVFIFCHHAMPVSVTTAQL